MGIEISMGRQGTGSDPWGVFATKTINGNMAFKLFVACDDFDHMERAATYAKNKCATGCDTIGVWANLIDYAVMQTHR